MAKIMVYGSAACPDCVILKEKLDAAHVHYGYVDVLAGLAHLKKFLAVRDSHPDAFAGARENGSIGIPTAVVDDAEVLVLPDAEATARLIAL
jgi:glutaredoxin-related protein